MGNLFTLGVGVPPPDRFGNPPIEAAGGYTLGQRVQRKGGNGMVWFIRVFDGKIYVFIAQDDGLLGVLQVNT